MFGNESVILAETFENDPLLNGKSIDLLTVSTNYNTTGDRHNNRLTVKDEKTLF